MGQEAVHPASPQRCCSNTRCLPTLVTPAGSPTGIEWMFQHLPRRRRRLRGPTGSRWWLPSIGVRSSGDRAIHNHTAVSSLGEQRPALVRQAYLIRRCSHAALSRAEELGATLIFAFDVSTRWSPKKKRGPDPHTCASCADEDLPVLRGGRYLCIDPTYDGRLPPLRSSEGRSSWATTPDQRKLSPPYRAIACAARLRTLLARGLTTQWRGAIPPSSPAAQVPR